MRSKEIPYLDDVIKLINENEKFLHYDYKGKENQLLIEKILIDEIHGLIEKHSSADIDKKEFLKLIIRRAFELSSNDVVLIRSGQIFIKTFDETTKQDVQEEDKGTSAGRYNGFSEEELRDLYQEFFEDEDNKDFLQNIANEFFQNYFIDNPINNEIYEKYVFTYIQQIIIKQLDDIYDDDNDGFFQGFSGYVFRLHFSEIFGYIADLMLYEISMNNTYMIKFLKYYSLNILVIDGKKYQIPSLQTEDGLHWNVVSMLSIAKVYTKSKRNLDKFQFQMDKLNQEMAELHTHGHSPSEYNALQIKKVIVLDTKIESQNLELEKNNDSLKLSVDEDEKQKILKVISKIKSYIQILTAHKKEIYKTMVEKSTIHKYAVLQKKLDALQKVYKKEKKVIVQNEKAYTSMRSSLVKALTSKKQLL